jgi:hypothetical protein
MRYALLFLLFIPEISRSHPVSLSWARVRVYDDHLKINFKILAEDLVLFHRPEPDSNYNYETNLLRDLSEQHKSMIAENFFVVDEKDNRLATAIVSVDHSSLEEEKIHVMDLMRYAIHYKIRIDLKIKNWEWLEFRQVLGTNGSGIPSITFLSVSGSGRDMVKKAEVTPENPFILRAGAEPQSQDFSELTSSFFTIAEEGIRHEITLPVSVFSRLNYSPDQKLLPSQTAQLYFSRNNPVFINEQYSAPVLKNMEILSENEGPGLSEPTGFVYLDIFYPAAGIISDYQLTWEDYTWKFRWFDSEILDIDSTYQFRFSRFQPYFIQDRKLKFEKKD